MNFSAKASSMKASTTLRVFIQPPDFGSFFSMQEKETSTRVSAMKKMPATLPAF